MAPGQQFDQDVNHLREKLAELEAELERQKARLSTGDERFRQLADAAPVMIWMSGNTAMYTFFNRCWLEFRGRTMQEEMGYGWAEGVHPDDRHLCLATYVAAFASRQAFRMQYRIQKAHGEYCRLEDMGSPHFPE